MMEKDAGNLVYTNRGFKQDAQDAMRGDVVRALIELITNSDDAYNAKGGNIVIHVRPTTPPFEWLVSIHDKAGGLEAEGLKKAFSNLGDENTKFVEDQGTRGLFGRGAKDVAVFGKARFHAVRDGRYSELQILPESATWEMNAKNIEPSSDQLSELRLKVGEAGLTAELYVSKDFKVPNTAELVDKLQSHVQLRDLLNRNEVILIDSRSKAEVKLQGRVPAGVKVLDEEIEVPGYSMSAKLEVYKFPEKQVGNVTAYSSQGLIISGRGAAYENSFLSLDGRPESGWFNGRLDVPEIHDLAKAIDREGGINEKNPTRVISRQRDGLVKTHPFYRALTGAVSSKLKPLFDEAANEEGANRREGQALRSRLDALEQALGRALQDLLDETDLGELPKENEPDDDSQELQFIPPRRILQIGENISLTVRAPLDLDHRAISFTVKQAEKVITLSNPLGGELIWRDHPRLNVKQTVLQLKGEALGVATIVAIAPNQSALCEVITTTERDSQELIPTELRFTQDLASISPNRNRRLQLIAPIEFVGEDVTLESDTKLFKITSKVRLAANASGTYSQALVIAQAGSQLGEGTIRALQSENSAQCVLRISESGQSKYPKIHTEVVGNDNPPRRVDMLLEDDGRLFVKIFGRHPSLQRVFGRHMGADLGFMNEQSPEAHATIGEIVAQQLSIYAVEREAGKHPERFPDSSSAFARQQEFIPRFIQLLQLILLEKE